VSSQTAMRETAGELAVANACPNCGTGQTSMFYQVRGVPVHDVLLMPSREAALTMQRGDIQLELCSSCGFVTNGAFDPKLLFYSEDCEETQGFSAIFREFQRQTIEWLIETYGIRGKRVVEVGCGKGEFLALLCSMGDNTGIGFDPAFVPARNPAAEPSRITFVPEFYSPLNAPAADVVCCVMTLEHIPQTLELVKTIRKSLDNRSDGLAFIQVPNFDYVLRDQAFWDIYYEHCSYFTKTSLRHLVELCGFDVISIEEVYSGQYLQVVAKPSEISSANAELPAAQRAEFRQKVDTFVSRVNSKISGWSDMLDDFYSLHKRMVLWGSGSKAVAFLSAMRDPASIEVVVDINPYRQNHHIPGSGHKIVAPDYLRENRPDLVIVMNPVYCGEIQNQLSEMGCRAGILSL
jgi:SAM-dependent methyltransferase